MSTLIVIPTYNERENILALITELLNLPWQFELLVVDDCSPDLTAQTVLQEFENNPRVHLIKRERKLGLGTAYAAGFRYSLERGYPRTITMDADFSHNPKFIPELEKASAHFDLVIGSRYVPGGSTINWGITRKVISRTANLLAHSFLSMEPSDCTSGLRLYHAETLRKVQFDSIEADGYSYLIEILHRVCRLHLRVGEIPIVFVERERGKSKISRKEILKAIHTILRLRLHSSAKTDGAVAQA